MAPACPSSAFGTFSPWAGRREQQDQASASRAGTYA